MKKIGGSQRHLEFLRRLYGEHEPELCRVSNSCFVDKCKNCGITVDFLDTPCTNKDLSQE